jgi:hypothetical protein
MTQTLARFAAGRLIMHFSAYLKCEKERFCGTPHAK